MKKIVSILLSFALLGIMSTSSVRAMDSSPIDQESMLRVDRYVKAYYDQNDVIGGIYGIIYQDKLIQSGSSGTFRKGATAKPTTQTAYSIASVTKTFTAAAIYQLSEEGLLDLDLPVTTYLPWFQFKQKDRSDQLTIRHLLTHSAGGVGSFDTDGLLSTNREARDSIEKYVRLFDKIDMKQAPGTTGNYCNGCFDLLGLIIEQVSGMSYYDYMEQSFFEPLGMKHTVFGDQLHRLDADQIAQEYTWLFAGRTHLYRNFEAFGKAQDPDGGIYSTIDDLSRYVAFQLGYAKEPLLQASSIENARERYVLTEAGDAYYTASGFETKELHGTEVYWKLGDGIGSGAVIMLAPEHDLGFVLLTGEYHPELQQPIAEGAISILLGNEPDTIQTPITVFRWLGFIAIGLTLAGLLLLGLVFYKRFKRKSQSKNRAIAITAIVCWGVAALALWYLLLFLRPSAIGFRGYPYDAAIGLGLCAIAASFWLIHSILRAFRR